MLLITSVSTGDSHDKKPSRLPSRKGSRLLPSTAVSVRVSAEPENATSLRYAVPGTAHSVCV